MTVTFADVEAAAAEIAGDAIRTPVVAAPGLSRLADTEIFLKLENLQVTGSFKARGARNRLGALDRASTPGVIACSAGNHAQGVACFAQRMDIPATIVMPRETPFSKIERTERYGARVILEGASFAEAQEHTRRLAESEGLTFIHPYDDDWVIAGQGTAGIEIAQDAPALDDVVIPIGGGGLIAGCAVALKTLRPDIRIIGVEAALYPSMHNALHGRSAAIGGATLAEGIAVKTPGERTAPIVREFVDEIVVLTEDAIENAVEVMADTGRLVVEGAGATPLGAVLARPDLFRGRRVGLLVSGGNIDMRVLASVLLRGLVRGGRMVRMRVQVSDSPGSLARIARTIGDAGGNIVEIIHQRMFYDVPVKQTDVDIVVETRNAAHAAEIREKLKADGLPTRLLSDIAGAVGG